MELQEFKELLIKSLNDVEVVDKLENIKINRTDSNKIIVENLSKYTLQIHDLNQSNKLLSEEVKRLKIIESNMESVSNELHRYKSLFNPMYKTIELYNRLTKRNKEALKGIFKNSDPAEFLISGVQQGNIESLWEYIKIQIMKQEYDDIDNLTYLFYYFIDLHNKTKSIPAYELLKTNTGDIFDVEMHIRTSSSKPSGKIKKIILQGFLNINTNIIIKKSVVEL